MADEREDDLLIRVGAIVKRHAREPPSSGELHPDAELSSLGLASLELVALLTDIEATLAVRFPTRLLHDDTFRTLRTLVEALQSVRRDPH
jgi:acyl carrier protein